MDPVTHGLTGALIAEAGFQQRLGGRSRLYISTAAMFPDIDILYRFEGLPTYIANHRALTHSFVGLIATGALLGMILGRLDEERRYFGWMCAMWVALFSHQILDIITSYGTVLLYPFNNARYYFDWVFIIDLFLSGTLLLFVILSRRKPKRGERLARFGLGMAASYIVFCALNHSWAMHLARQAVEEHQISYKHIAAIPQPFLPIRWSAIIDAGSHYYQLPFNNLTGPQIPFEVFTKTTGSIFEEKARDSELGTLYYWFARYPVVKEYMEHNLHVIEFSDLRFYIRLHRFMVRKPFVLRFKIDSNGRIIESRFART